MNHRGFDVRAIAYQAIKQVDGFEYTTRDKVAEQEDIHVAHMMIGDPSITPIPNVLLRQLILCSIRGCPFLFTPIVYLDSFLTEATRYTKYALEACVPCRRTVILMNIIW